MSDEWNNDGVHYTIDETSGPGAVITAQRQPDGMIYSRIIARRVGRREVESLFESHLTKGF